MKIKTRYIVLGVVAALAGAIAGGVWYVSHNLEDLVKTAVNKYGSPITGTEIKLGGFDLMLFKGEVKLKNLTVANPQGYAQPYILNVGDVYARVNLKSVLEPLIVVEEVRVENPEVTYELRNVTNNNVSDLLNNINKNTASGAEDKPAENSAEPAKEGKKVVVDLVTVTSGKVNIAASIAGQGAAAGIPLPKIEIKDIGREKNSSGMGIAETVTFVLKKILTVSYETVVEKGLGGLKDVATDGVKAVGDTAEGFTDKAKGFFKKIF